MVAEKAEELRADEPEVPVLQLVTQESPREEAASMRTRVAVGLLALAALFGSGGSTDPIGLIAGNDGG
jgi:hypothetical protein